MRGEPPLHESSVDLALTRRMPSLRYSTSARAREVTMTRRRLTRRWTMVVTLQVRYGRLAPLDGRAFSKLVELRATQNATIEA